MEQLVKRVHCDTDVQVEFFKAMQAIHAPCEEKLARELALYAAKYEDLEDKTSELPRWTLREEARDDNGSYISGCPLYSGDGFLGFVASRIEKSFVLSHQSAGSMTWHLEDDEYSQCCGDTIHGFVKLSDETLYRVICASGSVLERFTTWAEEEDEPLEAGSWGFIAALPLVPKKEKKKE